MLKICAALCAAALLGACSAPTTRRDAYPEGSASPAATPAYSIDPSHSEIRVLVHRAGPMARLGHNHVITNHAVGGWVADGSDRPAGAAFSLTVPTGEFRVDEPEARAQEGPDFDAPIPDDAKVGTRRNMLSAAVLDAEHFPAITLISTAVVPTPESTANDGGLSGDFLAHMTVEVAGHTTTLVAPFSLKRTAGQLTATGTVVLRQSDLGLTPLRVMLGALQVQDEMTVKFTLVAQASPPT